MCGLESRVKFDLNVSFAFQAVRWSTIEGGRLAQRVISSALPTSMPELERSGRQGSFKQYASNVQATHCVISLSLSPAFPTLITCFFAAL